MIACVCCIGYLRQCKEEAEADLVLQGVPWTVPVPKAIPVSRTDQHEKTGSITSDQDWQGRERPSLALATQTGYLEQVDEDEVQKLHTG